MYPQTLTVSSVGQITLPKSVHKLLGLEKGAKLSYEIDTKARQITLKKQKTIDEVLDDLAELKKEYPHPPVDSKWSKMTVGEMSNELAKNIQGDTWV